ncbi:MAG: RNA polymerase sigma factor RpoE [uncultured Thermomicrobiales bacterium]|uniref:RNA polymerase sigma factor RpoE n=1 Tax=uncultured Thermomicrobiales bacterium TaxID=1645740 RepID=A0A6J4VBQ9_9BACT|nr:MAG: RNA polymerase sigma factor RpoE [uncultured Thermomicrobiales bacterium]
MSIDERIAERNPTAPDHAAADHLLVAALRAGEEAAFVAILERYQAPMVRLATLYVRERAVAEEVVQETWIGVLRGIDGFEERSSFKTWLFRILTNQAKRRGAREGRSVPFSALARAEADGSDPAVDPERFVPPGRENAGHWAAELTEWRQTPEDRFVSGETHARAKAAIAGLPPAQRAVITLRDVDGLTAEEVCQALDLTQGNQRVLLHRARSKVRGALERNGEEA